METTILETERLKLRMLTPELCRHALATMTDDELTYYLGADNLALEKEKHAKGMTTYLISFRNFVITDKDTDVVFGRIGYHTWYAMHSRAEIGYGLHSDDFKNKGYMTEAMQAVLTYGFKEMQLNRVEAFASPKNEPSVQLLARHGFVQEGLLRQHYCKNGIVEDSACYGLLKNEFEALQLKRTGETV